MLKKSVKWSSITCAQIGHGTQTKRKHNLKRLASSDVTSDFNLVFWKRAILVRKKETRVTRKLTKLTIVNGESERCKGKDGKKNKLMDFSKDKSMGKLII